MKKGLRRHYSVDLPLRYTHRMKERPDEEGIETQQDVSAVHRVKQLRMKERPDEEGIETLHNCGLDIKRGLPNERET